jgi:multiple sugar transport system ATP-binding protein
MGMGDFSVRNRSTVAQGVPRSSLAGKADLALRPEHVTVLREPADGTVPARVYSAMPAGSETLIHCAVGETTILAKAIGQEEYAVDQKVWLVVQKEKANLYSAKDGALILGAIA